MENLLTCFKAYDVRGELGKNFDPDICFRIASSFARVLDTKRVVVGYDSRESSPILAEAIHKGLLNEGVEVIDIGLCGTEEMYSATSLLDACGGIEVTASHNPINFNGLKMVKSHSQPLDSNRELKKIKDLAEKKINIKSMPTGRVINASKIAREKYLKRLFTLFNPETFPPIKIVLNPGNGAAGPVLNKIIEEIEKTNSSVNFIKMHFEPDGKFPNGIPNPILVDNQVVTQKKVLEEKADLGVAFDGDFDRCFLFDEKGEFVNGVYLTGLLASKFLREERGSKIVHDRRLIWDICDNIERLGGTSILAKAGHAFIKEDMRLHSAVYGGEISSHHYFRDFFYCDSGMLPWLLVCEIIGQEKKALSDLIEKRKKKYPVSDEINFKVKDKKKIIDLIKALYLEKSLRLDENDGLSFENANWRFNVRLSNTENLLRLNVETKSDFNLLQSIVYELTSFIEKQGAEKV